MQEHTDSDLMAAYADSGDEKAFAELVARHQRMVYRVCLRMLGQHPDAEDATQAVFLVLFHKANRLTRQGELSGWLYGVARNVCLEALRRKARRKEETMRDEAGVPDVVESGPDYEAALHSLDEALAGLSGVLRQAVVLRYLQGYDQAEAARRAGCSTGTLASRASRGIERLRARLTRRGVTLSGAALAGLLASEASAAVPETLLPSILASVKGLAAATALPAVALGAKAGAGTGATSSAVALAKGVMHMMFIAQVKTVSLAAAACLVVAGTGGLAAKQLAGPSTPSPSDTKVAVPVATPVLVAAAPTPTAPSQPPTVPPAPVAPKTAEQPLRFTEADNGKTVTVKEVIADGPVVNEHVAQQTAQLWVTAFLQGRNDQLAALAETPFCLFNEQVGTAEELATKLAKASQDAKRWSEWFTAGKLRLEKVELLKGEAAAFTTGRSFKKLANPGRVTWHSCGCDC